MSAHAFSPDTFTKTEEVSYYRVQSIKTDEQGQTTYVNKGYRFATVADAQPTLDRYIAKYTERGDVHFVMVKITTATTVQTTITLT